jgi:predicted DNA-binding transcriptional regulator AlpA
MTAPSRRADPLPAGLTPRGLSRVEAAAYVGVSPTKFDELVKDGRMPKPKRIDARTIWDRKQVDVAFEALPDERDRNPWNDVAVRPLE